MCLEITTRRHGRLVSATSTLPLLLLLFLLLLFGRAGAFGAPAGERSSEASDTRAGRTRTVTDMAGREVEIPAEVNRVIASGSGALRLLTYLQAHDKIVAVDSAEMGTPVDVRPYAIANPQFADYPIFGDFRGEDNPELILALEDPPQVILKIEGGYDYRRLTARTGIPVVVLGYGNLGAEREILDETLRLMGKVVGAEQRAEEVISYLDETIADLRARGSASERQPNAFAGGIASRGAHGFTATDRSFTPFVLLGARNVAADGDGPQNPSEAGASHATIAREKVLDWNPDHIFLDLATTRGGGNGLEQLRTESIYRDLDAVRSGEVYGLIPYNSYQRNFGSVLANTYYIGTVLYPDSFGDIDPREKADEIYSFLNGRPALEEIEEMFPGKVFEPLSVQ